MQPEPSCDCGANDWAVYSIDQKQEIAWNEEKQAAYERWRAEKQSAAVAYLGECLGWDEQQTALARIEKKFSRNFAQDVRREFYGGLK